MNFDFPREVQSSSGLCMEKKMGGQAGMAVCFVTLSLLAAAMTVSVSVAARARAGVSSRPPLKPGVPTFTERDSRHKSSSVPVKVELQLESKYYTMYQYESHANLKIKLDGSIKWEYGNPNLYSLFHERLIIKPDSNERMYMLEATASAQLICMNEKGRFYTYPMENRSSQHPRRHRNKRPSHLLEVEGTREARLKDRRKKRKRMKRRKVTTLPPSDCFFKTFEFKADESYERAVGIYSYSHSNQTHGRFLSRNAENGNVRSYRRAFENLYMHSQLKITQMPVRYLSEMVTKTRFGRNDHFNMQVRKCLLHLLECPEQKEKLRRDGRPDIIMSPGKRNGSDRVPMIWRRAHLHKMIERCKRRARRTSSMPKCQPSIIPRNQTKT